MKQKIKISENELHNIISEAITAKLNKISLGNNKYKEYTTILDDFIRLNGRIQRHLIIGDYETVLNAFYNRFGIDTDDETCNYSDLYHYLKTKAHPEWFNYN